MRTQFFFASLALACSAAWADGSPLFSKASDASPAEVAAMKATWPEVTSVQSVNINREAINSTVITATVAGKDFRFVGGATTGGSKDARSWAGMDGAASLTVTVNGKDALGSIQFADRSFKFQTLKGKDTLIELVDTRDYTPEGVAKARAAQKQKAKT